MASKRVGTSAPPKGSISSPAVQTPQQPKPKTPPPSPLSPQITLKDLQDALMNTAKQIRIEAEELFERKNAEMREDILLALQGLASHSERIEGRVDEVEENVGRLEYRLGKVEENVDLSQNEIIMSQYRDMEFALRIRGLKENVQENLKEEIAADLALVLSCEPEQIMKEIEKIFRVNSWVARQRNLPRDVVIYFSRRSIRNEIIQAFYKQRFQIAAQDVIILKEIPPKILRRRKDFAFLADELKKRQIQFRWDIPVGIFVNYMGTRYRLNSIQKARDFYTSVLKAGLPSSPRVTRKEGLLEEQAFEGATSSGVIDLQEKSKQQFLEMKDNPKTQRMTRAAHRRKEKEWQKSDVVPAAYQLTSEPVGGTRLKRSVTADLQGLFQRLSATKDGKVSDMEC